MFESRNLLQRFANLSMRVPINNIKSGENEMAYVDFYLRRQSDVYSVLLTWRVVELIHELNLVYLELLCTSPDEKNESMKTLIEDMQKLEDFIRDHAPLKRHLLILKGVVSPSDTPALMKPIQTDIQDYLFKLDAVYEDPQITDGDSECDKSSNKTLAEPTSILPNKIALNRSILYSLNIVDEEKIAVLVTAVFSYYVHDERNLKLLQLLQLLKLRQVDQQISLFTLNCFLKLLCVAISSEDDVKSAGNEQFKSLLEVIDPESCKVLKLLAKLIRGWLNAKGKKECLMQELLSSLSDFVVSKSLSLNAI
ncbi:hypothetical protein METBISCDRAFT_25520 [Metschnikowia bicuspidata]|uniref:Uncharacterized protein n=1 Tax=Metschnikowia bicuspidata TaxID=27322 RepID=A0A4V1J3M5_9ASCO|nr:hypothetical protein METBISCDRAFT_25520 [Metschnikowia bicuspidata]